MEHVKTLIVGAGVTSLACANYLQNKDYLIIERDDAIGGYCKTVKQDGFVWDYSGHFFHFRDKAIEQMLVARMPAGEVQTIARCSQVYHQGNVVDFPFQKNIHQLPQADFIDCLYDLVFAEEAHPDEGASFKEMVYRRFGRGIAERFLVPYNEKLYACDLGDLDRDAMGRFFPYADLRDIVRNMRQADNRSYNATFTYPRGGAIRYVEALLAGVDTGRLALNEALVGLDLEKRVARTSKREIAYERLVSSAPFVDLLRAAGLPFAEAAFRTNKVLVFNLGFDRKGWTKPHWVYFPDRDFSFYRVGFYDNIFGADRMSLYVEIGAPTDQSLDVAAAQAQVLADLARAGIVDGHRCISSHHVVLDPAYVHITAESLRATARWREALGTAGVYSIGRYGGWTYCSIEDNIIEARALAERFNSVEGHAAPL